jgi:transposase
VVLKLREPSLHFALGKQSRMAGTDGKKRPRRRHSDEFRARAVRLVVKEKRPVAQVARDLDVSASLVHLWVRQAKVDSGDGPEGALTTEEKAELSKLRNEVRELRIERDIPNRFAGR